MSEKGEQAAWRAKVVKRLDEIYLPPTHETKEVWRGYLPHAQAALDTHAEVTDEIAESRLLSKVEKSYHLLGEYAKAKDRHGKALDILQNARGPEHPDTLDSMNNVALAPDEQCKYDEAVAMHRKVLALRNQVLGAEHPDTLDSMNNLARAPDGLDQYPDAEVIIRESLELLTKVQGAEHPHTIVGMNILGACY